MKAKVTLTIDKDLWHAFRTGAILRGASGSAEIEKLMRAAIERWSREKKK